MEAIVAALIAVIGIVVGWQLNQRSERERRSHDDAVRREEAAQQDRTGWRSDKRPRYAHLMQAAYDADEAVTAWGKHLRGGGSVKDAPETPDLTTVRLAYEEVRLIGPRAVVDAAMRVYDNLDRIVDHTHRSFIAKKAEPVDEATYADWWEEHVDHMEEFLAAARADLGVEPLGDSVAR